MEPETPTFTLTLNPPTAVCTEEQLLQHEIGSVMNIHPPSTWKTMLPINIPGDPTISRGTLHATH
jgi:hypothetical protein